MMHMYLVSVPNGGVTWNGKSHIGAAVRFAISKGSRATIGREVSFTDGCKIFLQDATLVIGDRSFIGYGTIITARESILIGKDVLIAEYVSIRDQDHVFESILPTSRSGFSTAPVVIGDNVWIGAKATITRGVTIGENSVIGANSVVTRDIPPNVVAAGAPARVIRELNREEALTGQSG